MCLQEIKLDVVSLSVIRSMWGLSSVGFVFLKAVGASRGIIVMWDKSIFYLVSSSHGEFSVTCIFQMIEGGFTWAFTGPQVRADKLRL